MNYLIAIWFFIVKVFVHYNDVGSISPREVFILISGLSVVVLAIRFTDTKYLKWLTLIASYSLAIYFPLTNILILSLLFMNYPQATWLLLMIFTGAVFYTQAFFTYIALLPFIYFLKHYYNVYKETRQKLTSQLDQERALRYDLEDAKRQLLNSQEEIIKLTEVHERNRIARDIHDKVGHQLTGTLLAIETSMMVEDESVKEQFLTKAHDQLKKGVHMIRETVHDMSTDDVIGFSSLLSLVEEFSFCEIDYNYKGDVNSIPTHIYVALIMNIKEAFTNIIKYSGASKVNLELEAKAAYIRVKISDNGEGSESVNEGLGLCNMRQRLAGIKGTMSYHSHEGFHIVMFVRR